MNTTQLLEVANKVFVSPTREAPKMGDKRMKQVSLLAASAEEPKSCETRLLPCEKGDIKRPTLHHDTCAYCQRGPGGKG